jgi:bacterial leucyl aminopeptidase
MSEESILKMLQENAEEIHFQDITDHPNLEQGKVQEASEIPENPRHQNIVNPLIQNFTVEEYKEIIDKLSSFFTRYYQSETGVQAAEWIHAYYTGLIKTLPEERQKLFEVSFFKHSWRQPSVICRFKGSSSDEKVIIGSHLDSINGASGRAPGADDDASGTAAVLQIFRAIAKSNFVPKKTIGSSIVFLTFSKNFTTTLLKKLV